MFNILGDFMRFFFFIGLIFSFSPLLPAQDWAGFSGCGVYEVRGVARMLKKHLVIVVNEKSQSEITIAVPLKNELFLAPYLDNSLWASVEFQKNKTKKQNLEGLIKEIKSRIPNPLAPDDTGIKLISKVECK